MNTPTPKDNKTLLEKPENKIGFSGPLQAIADELAQVKKCISAQLITSSGSINSLIEHVTARNGKMLRPAFVLLAGQCCGGITQTHVDIATVVELIHMATLLHDDVIDEAKSRRNAVTVNALRGNETAVLLGDFLLSRVFSICSRFQVRQIGRILSDTAQQICRGELRQNLQCLNWQLGREEYLEIVRDKTASLFSSSCYLGCFAAEGRKEQLQGLSEFGTNLGIAFQLTDDLVDIIGDEKTEGKTLGTDLAKHKLTLPVIHLLSAISQEQRNLLIERLRTGRESRQTLTKMLADAGSIDYTCNAAKQCCEEAIENLEVLSESPARSSLIETAKIIEKRCKA